MAKGMEFHQAAGIFPLNESEISNLADDIEKNGQQESIKIWRDEEGKDYILDGRRRWVACESKGIEPKAIEIETSDPISYVLSANLHRRHLTPSQRAMVAQRARALYDQQAKERQGTRTDIVELVPQCFGRARDQAGKMAEVSGRTIDFAKKVQEKGIPELIKAVDGGQIGVKRAAAIADEPEEIQSEKIADAAKRKSTRKEISEKAMRRKLIEVLARVSGACRGLSQANIEMAKAQCTPEEINDLIKRSKESAKILRGIASKLGG